MATAVAPIVIDRSLNGSEYFRYLPEHDHACCGPLRNWCAPLKPQTRRAPTRCLARFGSHHLAGFAGSAPDDFLVVYGSLMRGQPYRCQLNLEESLKFVDVRTISGTLYDMGDYPAFVHAHGVVDVELYRILDISVLSRLDEFEDYDRSDIERSLYRRTTIQLPRHKKAVIQKLFRNPTINAWIYVYNQPLNHNTKIRARSWPEHLAARPLTDGVKPFDP